MRIHTVDNKSAPIATSLLQVCYNLCIFTCEGDFLCCWCYVYSGVYDVRDVTLSVHPHRAS
jgi:hypothetical protein